MLETEIDADRPEDDEPLARNRTLLLSIGALVLVSAVIAAVVIIAGGGSPRPPEDPVAEVRVSGRSLLVGDRDAPAKVVVEEDFGSPASRAFELASRDFLRVEADQGRVLVTYRPVRGSGAYGQESLAAWTAALETGNGDKALTLHDRLFDRSPTEAAAAKSDLPVVLLDGTRLTARDGTELADRLQRRLLEEGRT